jgi:UPF0755 protein
MRKSYSAMLAVAVCLAGVAAWGQWRLESAMKAQSLAPAGTRIVVHPGESVRSVLGQLAGVGAVQDPRWVALYIRLHSLPVRVQAGTYEIAQESSVRQILRQLDEGQVVLEQLTIVEGWTFAQMRAALDAEPDLAHEWRTLDDAQLMKALGFPGLHPEGRFYPDSYRFAAGTPDRKIYELAFARMHERLDAEWAQRAPGLPLASEDEALVLASIVEKETGREDERQRVAAVFTNRLRKHMLLQTDPTVIYGLGAAYDGNLRRRDLESDTPYNTYRHAGLTPTPIALPGGASLHAALHPATEPSLYFVASGNGDGSHHFSATYEEHRAAVLRFLKATGARPDRQALAGHADGPAGAPAKGKVP